MFGYLKNYKRNRAFRRYVAQLGPALVKRYGMAAQYTVPQIYKTLLHLKLSSRYYPYALALFRHEHTECGGGPAVCVGTFQAIRGQIARDLFHGNLNYRAQQVVVLSSAGRWRGGASPDWMANRRGKTSL
jgi:hypothetical protein